MTEKVSGRTAPMLRRVAVIGGGITGLAAAQRLASRSDNTHIVVFESSQRLGGIIRTETADGFLMELGPDSFITNKPGAIQLCSEIGFRDQLIPTDSRFRRSLVLRNGKPVPVPDGFMLMAPTKPWAILTTPILSLAGRLRLLCEVFVARRKQFDDDDESLASFVRRRFGQQALERLVQPLVGGIYTADPEKLSLKATLPRFVEMEQSHGSVIRATLAQQKQEHERAANGQDSSEESSGSGARYGMFATAGGGLSDMVAALEQDLRRSGRVDFQLGVKVTGMSRTTDSGSQWMLQLQNQAAMSFDAVIVTLPTHSAARILEAAISQELQAALGRIEYASSAIVVSGHQLSDFAHPMDAFGLVIPAIEGRRILAVSFSSRKFRDRAPEGQILLRTFVGGAMQPELLKQDDDTIVGIVNEELRSIFGMNAEPMFSEVIRYNHAMPQYNVGHLERVARITTLLKETPGLQLAGSSYTGVGIPDSIASGWAAADNVIQHVAGQVHREQHA
ncbi:MAG: protoporphyrinogen oxidase [Planctomycetaceae bacterium]|nr:protoporphyrinogen oxidase [Planctomycetaceae bacterium]